ncbi:MAG: hypothetical protein HC868_15800 [Sphingomonadales bacterium]|nr:hypothetical protein [Sphingomonadales bacterium]
MRKPWQAIGLATAILTASTLYAANAQDKRGPMMDDGSMMGGSKRITQMMDHCSQMMGGGSTRPNEQWKKPNSPDKSTPDRKS